MFTTSPSSPLVTMNERSLAEGPLVERKAESPASAEAPLNSSAVEGAVVERSSVGASPTTAFDGSVGFTTVSGDCASARRHGPSSGARPRPLPLGMIAPSLSFLASPATPTSLTTRTLRSTTSIVSLRWILVLGTETGHCKTPLMYFFGWRRSSLDMRLELSWVIGGFQLRMATL